MSISARGSFKLRSPIATLPFELTSFSQRRLNYSFALSPLFILFYLLFFSYTMATYESKNHASTISAGGTPLEEQDNQRLQQMGKKPVLTVRNNNQKLINTTAPEDLCRTFLAKLRHCLDLWFQLHSSGYVGRSTWVSLKRVSI